MIEEFDGSFLIERDCVYIVCMRALSNLAEKALDESEAEKKQCSLHSIIARRVKGQSIYDGLLMMSRLHRFGCFFVPPIFESYKVV